MKSKRSLLVTWKFLRLFVNTLTADDKYSLLNRRSLTQHIQVQLSQKQKLFSELFYPFLKSKINIERFEKKMTFIAYVFPKLQTPK